MRLGEGGQDKLSTRRTPRALGQCGSLSELKLPGTAALRQAAAHQADAILLIAALHTACQLRDLREMAGRYGMAALVEVHDRDELAAAADSGAGLIGVNNRDLRTFEVKLETSLRLAEFMPDHGLKVSESGIHSREHVKLLQAAGYHAFLLGEHLVRGDDPAQTLWALMD